MKPDQISQMTIGQGFIAALDQSGGSTPKALANYGIAADAFSSDEQMFGLVHQMRTRIIKSPAFSSEHILGAILFADTMRRQIDGLATADYLWEKKHILAFLKVDVGLAELADGVQLMKPIDKLNDLLEEATVHHIFGTKMRSVIKENNPVGIKKIVDQQFELALKIAAFGLVPIIEPEIDINMTDKITAEITLKKYLLENLKLLPADVKVIFKLTLPSANNFYRDLMLNPQVIRVVALSGGYSREQANELLASNHGLIASFSRALLEGLSNNQTDKEFDVALKNSIKEIYNASIT